MYRCLLTLMVVIFALALPPGGALGKDCGSCGKFECDDCFLDFCADYGTRPECFIGTFHFDVVALDRSGTDDLDVLFTNNFNTPVLNNRQLDFDPEAGLRFGLTLEGDCGCDLQFIGLGVHDYTAAATRDDPGVSFIFFNLVPVPPATSYTPVYSSDLTSFQFNVRTRQWPRLSTVAGFRLIELEEEYDIFETGTSTGFFSDTNNEMYGLQFGIEALLVDHGRWYIETILRAGVYYNRISLRVDAADPTGGAINLDGDFEHTAFAGQLQVVWVYQISSRTRLRVGYESLYLDGVALAADQLDNSSFFSGVRSADLDSAVYQGGFLGLEFTW